MSSLTPPALYDTLVVNWVGLAICITAMLAGAVTAYDILHRFKGDAHARLPLYLLAIDLAITLPKIYEFTLQIYLAPLSDRACATIGVLFMTGKVMEAVMEVGMALSIYHTICYQEWICWGRRDWRLLLLSLSLAAPIPLIVALLGGFGHDDYGCLYSITHRDYQWTRWELPALLIPPTIITTIFYLRVRSRVALLLGRNPGSDPDFDQIPDPCPSKEDRSSSSSLSPGPSISTSTSTSPSDPPEYQPQRQILRYRVMRSTTIYITSIHFQWSLPILLYSVHAIGTGSTVLIALSTSAFLAKPICVASVHFLTRIPS